jgi:hypothetical protein
MDMASVRQRVNSEVFTALQAALRGEFDPLERFRVFLSAAKIEDEALRMGLAATKGELTDSAKKTATLALIMKQTKDAQGTSPAPPAGRPTSSARRAGGSANFATSIGQILLPAVQTGTGIFNEFLASVLSTFEENRGIFEGWAGYLTSAVEKVGRRPQLARRLGPGQDRGSENIINIGEYLAVIPATSGLIAEYIANNWLAS